MVWRKSVFAEFRTAPWCDMCSHITTRARMNTIPGLRGLLTSNGNDTSAGNSVSGGSRKRVGAIGSASTMLGRNGTAIVMNMMTTTISFERARLAPNRSRRALAPWSIAIPTAVARQRHGCEPIATAPGVRQSSTTARRPIFSTVDLVNRLGQNKSMNKADQLAVRLPRLDLSSHRRATDRRRSSGRGRKPLAVELTGRSKRAT